MAKKYVHNVCKIVATLDVEGSLEELISILQAIRDDNRDEYDYLGCSLQADMYDGGYSSTLEVSGTRKETEREKKIRVAKEKQARKKEKQKKKENERKLYERLKKKFEG